MSNVQVSSLLQAFRKCTGYNQTLYCDPDGQLYKSLGCFYGKYDSDGLQYSRNTGKSDLSLTKKYHIEYTYYINYHNEKDSQQLSEIYL